MNQKLCLLMVLCSFFLSSTIFAEEANTEKIQAQSESSVIAVDEPTDSSIEKEAEESSNFSNGLRALFRFSMTLLVLVLIMFLSVFCIDAVSIPGPTTDYIGGAAMCGGVILSLISCFGILLYVLGHIIIGICDWVLWMISFLR